MEALGRRQTQSDPRFKGDRVSSVGEKRAGGGGRCSRQGRQAASHHLETAGPTAQQQRAAKTHKGKIQPPAPAMA